MDSLIKKFTMYSLWEVSSNNLMEFVSFVANTNMLKHQGRMATQEEIEEVFNNELSLKPISTYYAIKTPNGKYIGTVRH